MYKKEIDTDVILNFSSMTPIEWKRSLIVWFLNRAKVMLYTNKKSQTCTLKNSFIIIYYTNKLMELQWAIITTHSDEYFLWIPRI